MTFTQLGMAVIIAIGMVGVFFPEKIQRLELKMSEVLTFGIPNPFVSFLETESYLRVVRWFGALTLISASAAEYLLFVR
jgi:hypothetical protein